MRKILRYGSMPIAALFAIFALPGSAGAAVAPNSIGQCDPGYVCYWSQAEYQGSFAEFPPTTYGFCTVLQLPVGSVWDRSDSDQYFYLNTNCTGASVHLCANNNGCDDLVNQMPFYTNSVGG